MLFYIKTPNSDVNSKGTQCSFRSHAYQLLAVEAFVGSWLRIRLLFFLLG